MRARLSGRRHVRKREKSPFPVVIVEIEERNACQNGAYRGSVKENSVDAGCTESVLMTRRYIVYPANKRSAAKD